MKNLVLLLALGLFATTAIAQEKKDLKSYEVKNLKPGERFSKSTNFYVGTSKNELKGAAFKNFKPWKNKSKVTTEISTSSKRNKLKGPKYKNYKPWKDNQ